MLLLEDVADELAVVAGFATGVAYDALPQTHGQWLLQDNILSIAAGRLQLKTEHQNVRILAKLTWQMVIAKEMRCIQNRAKRLKSYQA